MSRPKGMPPDRQPAQRVLDWLIKYAPSACSPRVISRALKTDELDAIMTLYVLEEGRFVVREESCWRAAGEEDP